MLAKIDFRIYTHKLLKKKEGAVFSDSPLMAMIKLISITKQTIQQSSHLVKIRPYH